jgi:outer membrane protein OmpA-like peptidoglycan-associated protein
MKNLILSTLITCTLFLINGFANNMDNGGQKGLVKSLSAKTLGITAINIGGTFRYDRDISYAKGPLGTGDVVGATGNPKTTQMLSGSGYLATGLTRIWDFSICMPVYSDYTGWGEKPRSLGDLEIATKVALPFREKKKVIHHGYYVKLIIPTGNEQKGYFPRHIYHVIDSVDLAENKPFTGNHVLINPMLLWTLDFNNLGQGIPLQMHGNFGGVATRKKSSSALLGSIALELSPSATYTLFAELNGEARLKLYTNSFSFTTFNDDPFWVTSGLQINFPKGFYTVIAANYGLSSTDKEYRTVWNRHGYSYSTAPVPKYSAQITLGWCGLVKEPDSDKDGIIDKKDKCPFKAEDKDKYQDKDGCPDPDNDKDGILDKNDKCPNEKATCDGCPVYDTDNDGILDDKDKCPSQAEDKDGFEDTDGCPDNDNDKDGLPDLKDKCPSDAEDKDNFEDEDGCPDVDNDKDDIPDKSDKCPNHKGPAENQGCPKTEEIRGELILSGVNFQSGKAKLTRNSYTVLDQVYESLNEWPEVKLEIQGHTDNRGKDEYNLKLSQRRADSVMEYLVKKGVDPSRLKAVGYGEENPISTNKTQKGRAENRRVELHRIQ